MSPETLTPGGCSPFLLCLLSRVWGRPMTDLMNMLPLVWSVSFSQILRADLNSVRFAMQITCTVASSDVSSSVIWDPSLSKVQWDQETQTRLSPARAEGGSEATSLPPLEAGVAPGGGWEQSFVDFLAWVPWFGLSLTNAISFQSESQCLVRDGECRSFRPKPTALPPAPSSSPMRTSAASERGVVTEPASLLHHTL